MKKKQVRPGRFRRYRRRIENALAGTHSKPVRLEVELTGCSADAWTTLHDASHGLPFGDREFLVLLLLRAVRKVREELHEMDRGELA